ncbi:MAG: hypothetical protein A2430_02310 [Candidatus Liptonbacteria bacterium RIFOXYC1_FULL_36_8]|uniref:Uncharacterized protein n=3 Tax=Candidatus Liptoniibacteriota TaxID=1817909 RepID=A0A1G2CLK8_9BACT|nr:MAG: hypothetical protein A2390_00935 [Candidatus Liptonbacteria bacterium RIFOXYB1_FULL_36_10]OGZ02891.1 MAG: hypothetical protein A2430_02310 [Candidatus Liptonbacteria bacterium RIFOXYC1_FULL_36_8]OGZ03210.1 MAG: hypothetical protein A2604_01855 [Candidatus Liptonbacteria bacterium RIFOXYD1_FULL_36_11]
MSKDRGEVLQNAHNKGEQDQRENDHNPPHSSLMVHFTEFGEQAERHNEENKAYDQGWQNAKKQG